VANRSPSLVEDFPSEKTGFCAGIFLELVDVPFFSILTEVQYTQKGSKRETGSYLGDMSLGYITIPVLAKLTMKGNSFNPYLFAGPRIDILVSDDYTDIESKTPGEIGIPKFESSVFGADVGLGLETTALNPLKLLFEFRYNFDFTNSLEAPFKSKSRSFGFLIGVGL